MSAEADAGRNLTPLWVPLGLSVGPLVALGLARFAYALLLPPMRTSLDWTYVEAGAMNTANAAGYLAGAIAAARLAAWFGTRPLFCTGIFGTAVAMTACGAVTNFSTLLLLRFGAGVFGALSFVLGASLAAAAGTGSSHARKAFFISVYFGGAGVGIALSSIIVPITLSTGALGWRWSWVGFGLTSALAGLLAIPAARHRNLNESTQKHCDVLQQSPLTPLLTAYTLFGAGYIAYMTFIVAFLRAEAFDPMIVSTFWVMLGLASVVAGWFWGRLLSLPGGLPTAVVLTVNLCGAAVPLLTRTTIGIFLSAILFGASLMAAPSAITAYIRKSLPPQAWTATIGRFTVLFGLGQCVGPILAGYFSDSSSGIRLGLSVSTVTLALAAVVAFLQTERSAPSTRPDG
jgi:predicted MFS family arabinose efflux permease